MDQIKQKVSIIIPTLNGAKDLPALFEKLKSQTIDVYEVIIVDSQSTDTTVEVAASFGANVLRIPREKFDHGGTRNQAAEMAAGEIIVFMTQDAIPANNLTIENLVKPLAEPNIIVSYARQLPKEGTKITDRFLRLYNYPEVSLVKSKENIETLGIKAFQNSNVCAAYCSKEFKLLGGFHQPIVSNEDMLFAAKAILAGYQVAYTASACVYHSHNYNYINLFKRYFDIGASLDYQPLIKQKGKANSKGLNFIANQLKHIIGEYSYMSIPGVFLEAIIKYVGFKLGTNHSFIPKSLKKYLGLHTNYWLNSEKSS